MLQLKVLQTLGSLWSGAWQRVLADEVCGNAVDSENSS